ncbi:MAG: D-alanine transaminase [Oleiphilaceae bacterium]|jgi:D-alanine transaminase
MGKTLGFDLHIARLNKNLKEIAIRRDFVHRLWSEIADTLIARNGSKNLGIYLHVSRGTDPKRLHAYPKNIAPTIFAFEIAAQKLVDKSQVIGLKVITEQDQRWRRCQIKSTSLLGNLMHYQQGQSAGVDETILFNNANELTEASACNVFIIKNNVLITPPIDHQLLGGITRYMLLDTIRKEAFFDVQERPVDMSEVRKAGEIWLTSSSKEIAPVIELDKQAVGDGRLAMVGS